MECNWMQNVFWVENGHGGMSQIEWRMHCNWVQNTFSVENGHGSISQSSGVCIAIGCRTPPRWRMVMAVYLNRVAYALQLGAEHLFGGEWSWLYISIEWRMLCNWV